MNQAMGKLVTVAKAAAWAVISGGIGSLTPALDDANFYEGPVDMGRFRRLFAVGAVLGLIGWYRKEVALATPVPVISPPPEETKIESVTVEKTVKSNPSMETPGRP